MIAWRFSFVIEPFAVHLGVWPARPGGAVRPTRTRAVRAMRPTPK
jgi:hypothetical protein